jgi:putative restriction endonuclease
MGKRSSGRVFGHVEGVEVGQVYSNRILLAASGLHRPTQAGISGSQTEGADSIVLSGGYEDDDDQGSTIVYTGHGGRDPNTKLQVEDQSFTRQNAALARNHLTGLPVRIIRGPDPNSRYAPADGYRYDGLFRVVDSWMDIGRSGFKICRFRLEAIKAAVGETDRSPGDRSPGRTQVTIQRIVRDTALSRRVKEIHNFRCQICGVVLGSSAGPYAEAAHIRPLGEPHRGPDIIENILCLCPNHHVLFDLGAISIDDNHRIIGMDATSLRTVAQHQIGIEHVRYHREKYCRQ